MALCLETPQVPTSLAPFFGVDDIHQPSGTQPIPQFDLFCASLYLQWLRLSHAVRTRAKRRLGTTPQKSGRGPKESKQLKEANEHHGAAEAVRKKKKADVIQRRKERADAQADGILKESIAESFEGMTLLDAALLQYSELEASFYQVLKEKNLSWFGKPGRTAPGDDAAPLLSVTKKPYCHLILSNTISVFDFRYYLVARQCLLLAKTGAIADVANKATRFISTFARTLRENENSFSEPFLESWIYSRALNVVDECDGWLAAGGGQESVLNAKGSYSAVKCELLELARVQLDKIGIRAGHPPKTTPFSTSLPAKPPWILTMRSIARPESTTTCIQRTLEDVLQATDNLSFKLLIDEFSPLDVRHASTSSITRLDNSSDGSFMDVVIIEVNHVKVKLRGRDGINVTFEHPTTKLPPGESALSLFCPDPMPGLFTTSDLKYQISRLLFQISPPENPSPTSSVKSSLSEVRATLRVPEDNQAAQVTMQMPRHDIISVVEKAVELAGDHPTSQRRRKEARDTAKSTLLNDTRWIDMLELIRQSSDTTDCSTWAKRLVEHAPIKLDIDSVIGAIKEMRETDAGSQHETSDERSRRRTVAMPFDVPLINIINRVRIVPQISSGALVYAGQPLDVTVTIEASFHWDGSKEELESKHLMRYDVFSGMDSGWLIGGPKRGEYIAQDKSTHTVTLTLLPLRHGLLALPIINAEPGEDSGGRRPSCETWQSDGAQKITVLPRNSRSTYTIAMPIPVI